MTEDQIHKAVVDWLKLRVPHLLWFHPANGGYRNKATAGRLKAMGVLPGVPDLVFVGPGGLAYFVELKTGGGRLNRAQKIFRECAEGLAAKYAVCRSIEDMEETLNEWGLL